MPDSNRPTQPNQDYDHKLAKGLFSHQVSDESPEMEGGCPITDPHLTTRPANCKDLIEDVGITDKAHSEVTDVNKDSESKTSINVENSVPLKKKRRRKKINKLIKLQRKLQRALNLNSGQDKAKKEEELKYQGFIGILAPEITEIIFKLLEPEDLASCSLVCKSWREAVNSDVVWRHHCKKRGWTLPLSSKSCYQKSSHYWIELGYLPPDLYPLCPQRLFFNRYAVLKKNWQERKFNSYYFVKGQNVTSACNRVAVPSLTCDQKYLVLFDTVNRWSIYNIVSEPFQVDSEPLQSYSQVTNIRICSNTIAIVQDMAILVYVNKNNKFELAYCRHVVDISSEEYQNCEQFKARNIFIEMNNDYLVGSSECKDFPAHVWDRESGDLIAQIPFDASLISVVNIFLHRNCIYFLMKNNLKNRTILIYDIKQTTHSFTIESFDQSNHLLMNSKYLCSLSEKRREISNVSVWNMQNGDFIKSIHYDGKFPSLVDEQILYCHNTGLTVELINIEKGNIYPIFNMDEVILSMKPIFENLLVTCGSTKVMVLDWTLRTALYTACYPMWSSINMWVDYEKVLLKLDSEESNNKIIILKF